MSVANVEVWGHRGDSGRYPENTMLAFVAAVEGGAGGIETDLQMTADGVFVMMHDDDVRRTTNGKGKISEMTFAQVTSLDAGAWKGPAFMGTPVPTLASLCAYMTTVSPDITLNLEWKGNMTPQATLQVLEMVHTHGLCARVVHSSFVVEQLERIRHLSASARLGILTERRFKDAVDRAVKLQAESIHPDYRSVTPGLVRLAHEYGLQVRAYTVNDAKGSAWVTYCGVDAIMTDWPQAPWWTLTDDSSPTTSTDR